VYLLDHEYTQRGLDWDRLKGADATRTTLLRQAAAEAPDLDAFLTSPARHVMEWPLAKDGRRHLHSRIDQVGLPIFHTTRRQGRPYVLVLTKTKAVFTREQATRTRAETDLAWLRDKWPRSRG
jgi:hypothetical protein